MLLDATKGYLKEFMTLSKREELTVSNKTILKELLYIMPL